ncbi:MAG: HlyD family secretion protein, partial [Gammaproteobacteria bacterium]
IEAARLAAREQQIEAARAQVAAASASLRQARTALDKRKVAVPRGGRIVDVFYRAGEVVTAGQPIVEILPPENVRVRFYVPEPRLAGVEYGKRVSVACDGCPRDLAAVVSYIAQEAEFTPPVIFTREERAKLVFMIEATPLARSDALKPGLPVEVMLAGTGDGN